MARLEVSMRSRQGIQACAGIVLIFIPVQVLESQREGAQDGGEVTAIVATNGNDFGTASGKPFIASWKRTSVWETQNGKTDTAIESVKAARDSAGRTYFEETPNWQPERASSDRTAPFPVFYFYTVWDTVKRCRVSWNSTSKQVHVTPNPGLKPDSGFSPRVPWDWKSPEEDAEADQWDLERLGSKTVHGVVAEGIRATHLIPAGKEGNDQP